MAAAMVCIICPDPIGTKHRLQCITCCGFVHRTCLPPMSSSEFSHMKTDWKCKLCSEAKNSPAKSKITKSNDKDSSEKSKTSGKLPTGGANGPLKCCLCRRLVEYGQHKLQCFVCTEFAHRTCFQSVTTADFAYVKSTWSCPKCSDALSRCSRGKSSSKIDLVIKHDLPPRELPDGQLFDSMKFAHLNVNGIKSKRDDIEEYLQKQTNLIVLAIAESKLTGSDESDMLKLDFPGYSLYRADRGFGERGGGQLIYINNECRYELIEFNELPPGYVECNIIRIKLTSMPTTVVCVIYVPPQDRNNLFFEFFNNVCKFLRTSRKTKGRRVVIMGDFNVHWGRETANHRKLDEACDEFNLKQIISKPTRKDAILDHIYVDKESKVTNQVSQLSTSDHKLVTVVFK